MRENIKLVPQRRFREFRDGAPWEQRKLGEVAEFNPKAVLPELFEYVDLESVVGTEMIAHRTEIRTSAPSRAQRLARQGDLFYQTVRPYYKNNYLFEKPLNNDNYVFSTGYAQIRPNVDGWFLLSLVQRDTFVKSVLDRCTGTSYPAISANNLADIDVNVPVDAAEQKDIGILLRNLDNLTILYQRKLGKIKDLKSAYLSQMFPKEGEKYPKLRFPGFTNAWKQCKLDEISGFSKGQGYTKNDLTQTGTPIILYGRLYTKYQTVIEDVDTYAVSKLGAVYSKGSEVIVPSSGETAEDIARASAIMKPGILLGGDLNILYPNSDIDSVFLALSISNGKQQKELAKKAQGKSVVHLYNADLKEVILAYPSKEEQMKISSYFRNLDNLITTHQRKLVKLQNIKKAYLSEMFV